MATCPVDGSQFADREPHDLHDALWDYLPCGSRRTYCSRRCAAHAKAHRAAEKRARAARAREQRAVTQHQVDLEAAGQQRLELVLT